MIILPKSYLAITETDILLDNIPTTSYNNINLWNIDATLHYFNNARVFFLQEFGLEIEEFHILQASNCSKDPIPSETGHYSWERIYTKDKRLSDWVLTDFYPSKLYCAANSACDSANLTRANSAFRAGLVQTLPKIENILRINLLN